MHVNFKPHVDSLHDSLERMLAMPPVKAQGLPRAVPERGIYLFSEGEDFLYVGRTNRMRNRLMEHGRRSSSHNSAPFAFLLAKEKLLEALSIQEVIATREQLEANEVFRTLFGVEKQRVRNMDIRFVEETHSIRQALLEVYIAVSLGTRYNDFDNH